MPYFFARLDEKHKMYENFEKIWKYFDRNSIENLKFYLFLENLLLKIDLSEITFSTAMFPVSGLGRGPGGISPFLPWLRPWLASVRLTYLDLV